MARTCANFYPLPEIYLNFVMVTFHEKRKESRYKQTNKQKKISFLFTLTEALEQQALLQSHAHRVLYNTAHLYTLGSPQYNSR